MFGSKEIKDEMKTMDLRLKQLEKQSVSSITAEVKTFLMETHRQVTELFMDYSAERLASQIIQTDQIGRELKRLMDDPYTLRAIVKSINDLQLDRKGGVCGK